MTAIARCTICAGGETLHPHVCVIYLNSGVHALPPQQQESMLTTPTVRSSSKLSRSATASPDKQRTGLIPQCKLRKRNTFSHKLLIVLQERNVHACVNQERSVYSSPAEHIIIIIIIMQADTLYPNNNKQAANIIESAKLKAASSCAALLRRLCYLRGHSY